ncbi:phosphoglycerate mutase family protein [Necator americanus]|uniref:Phosphoglycerate mutase family protein n=1 Tax=Necator americanus TaxID=51031 RepID=W2TNM6_NECAM|nr:phosphoglycerate mutase family protein [Necator americanus]ETN83705.1 phosphoglycerate mutase family protein [Necator americanus]
MALQLHFATVFFFIIFLHILLFTTAFPELNNVEAKEQPVRRTRGCPLSPYATFLSEDQQETLHELVTEARQQGADESIVKEHIDKYISKVLPPQKYAEFRDAFERFEANRREKRGTEEKKLPKKVFDLVDQYSGSMDTDYSKFYKDNDYQCLPSMGKKSKKKSSRRSAKGTPAGKKQSKRSKSMSKGKTPRKEKSKSRTRSQSKSKTASLSGTPQADKKSSRKTGTVSGKSDKSGRKKKERMEKRSKKSHQMKTARSKTPAGGGEAKTPGKKSKRASAGRKSVQSGPTPRKGSSNAKGGKTPKSKSSKSKKNKKSASEKSDKSGKKTKSSQGGEEEKVPKSDKSAKDAGKVDQKSDKSAKSGKSGKNERKRKSGKKPLCGACVPKKKEGSPGKQEEEEKDQQDKDKKGKDDKKKGKGGKSASSMTPTLTGDTDYEPGTMICSQWPRAVGKKQANRIVVIMRSAERVDRVFGPEWKETEASHGYFTPTDLNIPHNSITKKLLYSNAFDDNPPITSFGKYCTQLSARAMCNRGISTQLVVCSPALRSVQTGDALSRFLKAKLAIEPGLLEPLAWYRGANVPFPDFGIDQLSKFYPIDKGYNPVMSMETMEKLYEKETEAQGVQRVDFVLRSLAGEQRKHSLVIVGHAITLAVAVALGITVINQTDGTNGMHQM